MPIDCQPGPNNACVNYDGGSSFCDLYRTTVPLCKSVTGGVPPDCPTCRNVSTYECGLVSFYNVENCPMDEPDEQNSWYACGC